MRKEEENIENPGGWQDHPETETWVAYAEGRLTADENARLRHHLGGCECCVALVLDLNAFLDPDEDVRATVSEFELAAAWRAMKPHLATETASPPARRPSRFADRRVSAPLALAASLAVAIAGGTLWSVEHRAAQELHATVAELTAPQINVPIVDLYPDTAVRSGAAEETATVPASRSFHLVLNLAEPVDFSDYKAVLLDAAGEEVWSSPGLEMDATYGNFSVTLSRELLSGERYEVQLFGLDGDAWNLLESYKVEI